MTRDARAFDRELEVLLERARTIRPVPCAVRARALTHARATVATSSTQ